MTRPAMIIPLDYELILGERKETLIALFEPERQTEIRDLLALESEPLTKLLQEASYRELILYGRINDAAVSNLIAFAQGTDLEYLAELFDITRQVGESDSRLRERLLLRIAAMAGNGTREYYLSTAMSVNPAIKSAAVMQPWPGAVTVIVWVDSEHAEAIAETVHDVLNNEHKKMLGVVVTALAAREVAVNFIAKIWRTENAPADLAQQISNSWANKLAEHVQLGKPVTRSWIIAALHQDGVSRVELISPISDLLVEQTEFIRAASVSILDGGVGW